MHLAGYAQDDWRVHPQLTLNLGLRYEVDTDVNNISRVDELNPIVAAVCDRPRHRDINNWAPRVGFNWSTPGARSSVRGGYGIYYDRDHAARSNRSSAGSTAGRCRSRCAPATCSSSTRRPAGCRRLRRRSSNPFTGFILPGAGASGINIIDPHLQNPMVQQASIGIRAAARRAAGAACGRRAQPTAPTSSSAARSARCSTRSSAGPIASSTSSRARRPTTTACSSSFERRYTGRFGLRGRLHAVEGQELRQRRSDSVRQRTARSEQPRRASTAPRPTISGIGWRCPASPTSAADFSCPGVWTAGLRRADGHPDAGRSERASRCCRAMPAAASSRRPAS